MRVCEVSIKVSSKVDPYCFSQEQVKWESTGTITLIRLADVAHLYSQIEVVRRDAG